MLNRRHLRIKVMQALYSYFQTGNKDIVRGEKELRSSVLRVYDLYISLLHLLLEIQDQSTKILNDAKNKRLPTALDLMPNLRFVNNEIFTIFSTNTQLKRETNNRKITWQTEDELVRKIITQIKAGPEFKIYEELPEDEFTFDVQKQFIINMFKNYICDFELLGDYFEQRSIYWVDDLRLVNHAIIKTIEGLQWPHQPEDIILLPLFKDELEDQQFLVDLYRKCILFAPDFEKIISDKTTNWEVERIAMMDILLMKMALTEILHFDNIPVKVTLNEYIEISKLYSSPKSKVFINGILDKLVADFKVNEKIQKTGRGLCD